MIFIDLTIDGDVRSRRYIDFQCALKTVRSRELAPFQKICTPMQTSKNDDSRMIDTHSCGADQRCEAIGKAVTDIHAESE